MAPPSIQLAQWKPSSALAVQALRSWTPRQIVIATIAAGVIGVLVGVATVLIPNAYFARDIPPVWWNYPVWILTSVFSGMLMATYVRPSSSERTSSGALDHATAGEAEDRTSSSEERRTSRFGMTGMVLAWFAVGCPVCNKIALIALGYSGAITYFTPLQPILALGALLLTGLALIWRLKGQVACTVRPSKELVTA
ncbi:hypothetical protein I2485_13190 [Nesterenkonia sp. E16_7]|uniref:hypothetical protein n=1 Tax=unclassified Nesterenkonia TaxID=2629769 RepID=UPI001A9355D2|nr:MULTISPECIES: hypothetical protein [unclassified Nesterenkonia]MBO0595804.1 hypothetical protein [Nesterenkonia sp. E16_10]MBO0599597.1 hypothetical protein [Nesterenkonia sp. E16_7]